MAVWALLVGWVIVVGTMPSTWDYEAILHDRLTEVSYNWSDVAMGIVWLTLEWVLLYHLLIWPRIAFALRVFVVTVICFVLFIYGPGTGWSDVPPIVTVVPFTQGFIMLGTLILAGVVGTRKLLARRSRSE